MDFPAAITAIDRCARPASHSTAVRITTREKSSMELLIDPQWLAVPKWRSASDCADELGWELVQCALMTLGARSGKANLSHRTRDDEDTDVIGKRIGRRDEESVAIGSVGEGSADDDLIVHEGNFDAASVPRLAGVYAFDVAGIAGEIANEEDPLEPGERNDDPLVGRGGRRWPERELLSCWTEVMRVALENLAFGIAHHDLLPG